MTFTDVLQNIRSGVYVPDPELCILMRLAIQGEGSRAPIEEYNVALARGWERFINDALIAVNLHQHPRVDDIVRFAIDHSDCGWDTMQCLMVLKKLSRIINNV